MTEVRNLYSKRADERRRQFNNIIRGIDMVLMNNIPEVDESVLGNWEGESPFCNCDVIDVANAEGDIRKI